MNKEDQARRTSVEIFFDGADITQDIKPYHPQPLRFVYNVQNEKIRNDILDCRK